MDKNLKFHKELKKQALETLVAESPFKNLEISLKTNAIKNSIEQVLSTRKNNFFDFAKDFIRKNKTNSKDFISLNEVAEEFWFDIFKHYPSKDLQNFKAENLQNEILSQDDTKYLKLVEYHELPVSIQELLKKYEYQNLLELIENEKKIEIDDLKTLYKSIKHIASFRKRKINAIHTLRYSQNAPLTKDIEEFIFEAHALVSKPRPYRKESTRVGFHIKVLEPEFIQSFMKKFADQVEKEPQNLDINSAETLALKYYLFFEAIHPFADGNGRTGRALFTYLIRKFTQKNEEKNFRYSYIPIETNGSNSAEKDYDNLGSISGQFSSATNPILRSKKMIELFNWQYKNENENFFNNIWNEINNNHEESLEKALDIQKELIKKDTENKQDFVEILDVMKRNIQSLKKPS